MSRPLQKLRRFFRELKRRKVYRVAVAYLVVAVAGLEAVGLLIPATTLPAWADELLVALAVFGFPVALVLAWAFEMTPEGVRRTPARAPEEEGPVPGAPAEAAPGVGRAEAPGGARGPAASGRRESRLAVKALVGLGLLAAAVAGGWYLVGGGGETEPEARDRSVAVLPFENMGGEESEQFTRGVHDGLLTRLSNISQLRVISRTSVLPYRDTELGLPAIADSLGVRWVVEGAVQQAGDRVRVNAQLIQAEEDAHRWAESYQRELTTENLFAVQSELTKKIARSLEAELSPEEEERVERRHTGDLEAYRLYLEGRMRLGQRTEPEMRRAVELFGRAIARDSGFALAWSGLADAHTLLGSYGHGAADTLRPEALSHARRAVELAPELAEARASLGLIYFEQSRGVSALRELQRAAELSPSYLRAHHWLGIVLRALGRPEASVRHLERAVSLDPRSPPIHLALSLSYSYAGRLEDALREARRAADLKPGYTGAVEYSGRILSKMGRQEEAIASLERALEEMDPRPEVRAWTLAWLVVAHHEAGDGRRARDDLERLERSGDFPFMVAIARLALGDRGAAYENLERASFGPYENMALRYSPVFDPLREEPRFRRLVRRMNQAWGLDPDGSLPDSVDVSLDPRTDG